MKKALLSLFFVFPFTMLAAEPAASHSADQNRHGHTKNIVGSVGVAGMFSRQYSLNTQTGGQYNSDGTVQRFAGWSATGEAKLHKQFSAQVDFLSLYNTNANPHMSKFGIFAGPRYTFHRYWKATPFLFGEAGELRTSYGMQNPSNHPGVDWNPAAKAGVGFDMKLSRNFAFQAVPAEWMGERFDWSGKWQNNYQARAGFVFYLRK